ncbi:uncharacterized protein LOC142759320 [Rhinoderma darwinii]|uniref:uncharacterized protein LOC142759320 n=1 Tax=Rhinoderma darwinii TaxID=43563 RepID=UPI003F676F36
MDVEKLICLVQERHEIWDTRAESYHDHSAKEVAWDHIGQALFSSEWDKSSTRDRQRIVQDLKTRWRSCRDQFRREFGDRGRSGDGATKKRRYIYTNQLMFLKDIMEMRSTTDNLNDSEEESDHAESQPDRPSSRLLPLTPEPTPQDPAPVESAPPELPPDENPPHRADADTVICQPPGRKLMEGYSNTCVVRPTKTGTTTLLAASCHCCGRCQTIGCHA